MTELLCSLKSFYPSHVTEPVQQELWSVTYSSFQHPSTRLDLSSPPKLFFLPHAGLLPVYRPNEKRRALDRFTLRLVESKLPGALLGIDYLQKKYRHNLAADTIKQSGSVVLSFLTFLNGTSRDILNLSSQDIEAYVENEQERGLKVGTVRTNLRAIYTFIGFLVEQEVAAAEILLKKIRIKPPEILPKAIPLEDIEKLLAVTTNIRDRALILLLLRTGMRIGELLNVKISDIILSEQKILIYLGEKNYQGRVVYFGDDADQALRQWLQIRKKDKEFLFYSPCRESLGYVAAWSVMRKHLEAAEIAHKGYSLHCLRHTFATDMLNAGLRLEVLQQLLGHRSIEITRRYARMSDITRETEYFKAMTIIETGGKCYESQRVNSPLQAVFEEKKFGLSHG
ncbi:MAG: tyrosine-type recombinase/integrase [Desulfobulbaceae bacterium]|jgi:integrase/recombinase XerD|nr:tyrosine-type recombinase/integrase [Desulfobulbaceae bacterium]